MFDFKDKIVVVTGGARGIGKCIRQQFEAAGATVCVIDRLDNDYFVGDLADKATLEAFAAKVIADAYPDSVPGQMIHKLLEREEVAKVLDTEKSLAELQEWLRDHY